jgi:tRNA-modifying protein YgfZ
VTTIVARSAAARRVDVTGADRARYLEDVTSQHLVDLPPGQVTSALVLDAHGGPLAVFDLAVLGDRLVLLAPDPEVATTLVEVLGGRTFLSDAHFEARTSEVVAVRGPAATELVAAVGLGVVPDRCRLADDVLVVARGDAVDLVVPAGRADALLASLVAAGARAGGADELLRWRVHAGVPGWGTEIVAPHLPEELGLLPSHVHLAKGCYPGQEAVARMWMLGRPRRRLAVVAPRGLEPTAGWEGGEGRRRVTVTSVCPDGDAALAFVPGDAVPGDAVPADAVPADAVPADAVPGDGGYLEVVRLVGDEALPPGHDPAVVRRRDRAR